MKIANIKFEGQAYYSNGKTSKLRWFATEKAMRDWANAQFRKDEGVTVYIWKGFGGFVNNDLFCTYHA